MKANNLQLLVWSLSTVVVMTAFFAWGQGNNWQFSGMSTYQLFPLFGLVAFSLMWSHYIAAALRVYFKIDKRALASYFEFTSLAVLAAILLHPGLLAWQLWRDTNKLPPGSELNYLGKDMRTYILIAMIALLVFLAYEFRRKFQAKSWWKFVQYASDGAMILILIHSLKVGSQLQTGWLLMVWYFYGLTLFGALAYIYTQKFKKT